MENFAYLDFYQDIIKGVAGKSKIVDTVKIERYRNASRDLKRYRERGILLKRYINQVNYLYHDGAMREHAICTESDYFDDICNNEKIEEETEKAINFIDSLNISGFEKNRYTEQIKELYSYNHIRCDETSIIKTVEYLIKQIKSEINK